MRRSTLSSRLLLIARLLCTLVSHIASVLPAIAGGLRVAGSLRDDEASVQHCLQVKREARNIDVGVERARVWPMLTL